MSVSLLTAQELFGLYELDAAGTVLYYRIEPCGKPGSTSPDMAGHNFYDEVAPFENVEEFRRCVTRFTRGEQPADNFKFDCRYAGYAQPVKVLLARIRERLNHDLTKSVLVHIRQGA
ncbi:MAG: hypothetical protein LC802_21230 [Acidobacteria bacterium]|nr:hypothetical protein [Acidobacteriota bacterium]